VLVQRVNGRGELIFHASPETGAIMTPAQAVEIVEALTVAAENRWPCTGGPASEPGDEATSRAGFGGIAELKIMKAQQLRECWRFTRKISV
jgi:hypothetical protein